MPLVKIIVTIPFPLRVDPKPYRIEARGVAWSLNVERVQREYPDERIAGPGTRNVDLHVDRAGLLAFSRITGEATMDAVDHDVAYSLLDALNLLVLQVRDVFSEFWISTLEPDDLYSIMISVDGQVVHHQTVGRGGGFCPAVIGRTDEGNARLDAALATGQYPPVWRQIQLDARDALSLGRYEDCVLLGWSALEAACRQALPGMAYRAGLSPRDLARRLDPQNRTNWRNEPPYSHEDAVRRVSGGPPIIEAAAELTEPRIYDPPSVRGSVDLAYRLRNAIVHQGARIQREHAERVWRDVDSVLRLALSLRDVPPPPPTLSWRARFRRVRPEVEQFVAATGMRLVVWRPPRDAGFEMEMMDGDLWLRFANDVPSRIGAALLLTQWDSWRRRSLPNRARLQAGQPSGVFLEGWVTYEADAVEAAVSLGEALISAANANKSVREMAALSVSRIVPALAAAPALQIPNPEMPTRSAQVAAHLAVLPRRGWARRLKPLKAAQPDAYHLIRRWAEAMVDMDPDHEHSRCGVLRLIAANSAWLDTILVICPIEGIVYGSRSWPVDQAPF